MLPHPTLERLTGMGFAGMARAFAELSSNAEAERLTHQEWLGLLLDREWSFRHDRMRIPTSSRSRFLDDGDQRSNMMAIRIPR